MRGALLIALLVTGVGCGAAQSAPSAPATSLTISFWADGRSEGTAPRRWTLRCGPVGGTLPRAASACTKLAAMTDPFAPLRKDVACTQQYGGPQEAVITGTFEGRRIWVVLALRNGCEIARARKLSFLVPGLSPSSAAF